jgi:hypothetical protein
VAGCTDVIVVLWTRGHRFGGGGCAVFFFITALVSCGDVISCSCSNVVHFRVRDYFLWCVNMGSNVELGLEFETLFPAKPVFPPPLLPNFHSVCRTVTHVSAPVVATRLFTSTKQKVLVIAV